MVKIDSKIFLVFFFCFIHLELLLVVQKDRSNVFALMDHDAVSSDQLCAFEWEEWNFKQCKSDGFQWRLHQYVALHLRVNSSKKHRWNSYPTFISFDAQVIIFDVFDRNWQNSDGIKPIHINEDEWWQSCTWSVVLQSSSMGSMVIPRFTAPFRILIVSVALLLFLTSSTAISRRTYVSERVIYLSNRNIY